MAIINVVIKLKTLGKEWFVYFATSLQVNLYPIPTPFPNMCNHRGEIKENMEPLDKAM